MPKASNRFSVWTPAIAAAALLATTRALLFAINTGYIEEEAWNLLWIAASKSFTTTLAVSLPLALVARVHSLRLVDRPVPGLFASALYLILFLLVLGTPWPLEASLQLGSYELTGRQATLIALLGGLLASSLISPATPKGLALPTALAGLVAALFGAGEQLLHERASWPERPNLVLVSVDTQRPDHLSCYGYERVTSPNIDRFAGAAVRFDRAFTPYPWTLLAHMSLFTSLNPTAHGVTSKRSLSAGIPTLAEHLQAGGYKTVAVIDTVKWLSPEFRFDRGFDLYRQVPGLAGEKRRSLAPILDDLGGRPLFLFLHFFDVHSDGQQLPYESAPEDMERFAGDYRGDFTGCEEGLGCASKYLIALSEKKQALRGEDLEYLISLYDAGVRTFDREFGLVLDELKSHGLYENSVIAITSDHGEAFFEHGVALHGGIYEEVVRIPLLIKTPDTKTARVESPLLSMIDIAPTLLDYAGIPATGMQGHSFRDIVDGASTDGEREWVLLEDGRGRWHGIRTKRWKAIRYEDRGWALYDLEVDPGEFRNLLRRGATPPPEWAELRERYETELARMQAFRLEHAASDTVHATEAERAELEGLGYLGEFDD